MLGPVFRTYEPTRDRLIAVKVFRLDITPEQAQALADELARAADAGLFHPSIVEPIAAGIEGTVAYRAEEYVAAESLDVAMRHYAPASLDKVLPFITQLADAIDFARAAGIGHGALHPRDIFVTPDEARATGFGVVDALDRLSLRAPVRRPYSAPERVASESWSTPADIFSLSAIAFELLTGRRPSGIGDQIGPLTGAVVTEHVDAIRDVLARGMEEDPRRRFESAKAFAVALEAATRGEEISRAAEIVTMPSPAAEPIAVSDSPASDARDDEPSLATADTEVPDDIAVERDEDEAHWVLTRSAAVTATETEGGGTPLFGDEPPPVDELTAAAADIALTESAPASPFHDDFRSSQDRGRAREAPVLLSTADEPAASAPRRPILGDITPPRPRTPHTRPTPVVEPGILRLDGRAIAHDPSTRETQAGAADRSRVVMLPLAITLIVGLLIGFAAGYAVGGRERPPDRTVTSAGQPTTPPGSTTKPETSTASAPSAGKEWSEQAVSQPQAKSPATAQGTATAAPSPDVRGEPKGAAPKAGKIVVRSTPPGAAVTINGRWRGRTPLAVNDARFGDYSMRVVLPGYEAARQEFRLSPQEATRTLSFDLQRQRREAPGKRAATSATPAGGLASGRAASSSPFGSIFVDSLPRGARVVLDGKAVGVTPLRIADVSVGSHAIRLELADHRPWANSAQVTAGQEARVTGSLDPIR